MKGQEPIIIEKIEKPKGSGVLFQTPLPPQNPVMIAVTARRIPKKEKAARLSPLKETSFPKIPLNTTYANKPRRKAKQRTIKTVGQDIIGRANTRSGLSPNKRVYRTIRGQRLPNEWYKLTPKQMVNRAKRMTSEPYRKFTEHINALRKKHRIPKTSLGETVDDLKKAKKETTEFFSKGKPKQALDASSSFGRKHYRPIAGAATGMLFSSQVSKRMRNDLYAKQRNKYMGYGYSDQEVEAAAFHKRGRGVFRAGSAAITAGASMVAAKRPAGSRVRKAGLVLIGAGIASQALGTAAGYYKTRKNLKGGGYQDIMRSEAFRTRKVMTRSQAARVAALARWGTSRAKGW